MGIIIIEKTVAGSKIYKVLDTFEQATNLLFKTNLNPYEITHDGENVVIKCRKEA